LPKLQTTEAASSGAVKVALEESGFRRSSLEIPKHIPELDGLRGIAIAMVLLLHTFSHLGISSIAKVFQMGWAGVDLFFVLSGFLISRILLDAKGRGGYFTNFYARRALRIWPLYYLIVGFSYLVVPHMAAGLRFDTSVYRWTTYALYLQNLFHWGDFGPWPLGVAWSLAIEEQFYLVWPLLIYILPARILKRVLISIAALVPAVRFLMLYLGSAPVAIYTATPFRLDSLAIGSLIAVLTLGGIPVTLRRQARLSCFLLLPLSAVLICGPLRGDKVLTSTGPVDPYTAASIALIFSMLAVGFAGLIAVVLSAGSPIMMRVCGSSILRYLGKVSYGLYLYHGIIWILGRALVRPQLASLFSLRDKQLTLAGVLIEYTLLFAVAYASWRWFEQPLLKLKSHFEWKGEKTA
jgi:peptidoglycan/LPS O-acetylase OafA/YrhL